jgi:hypothetical protein
MFLTLTEVVILTKPFISPSPAIGKVGANKLEPFKIASYIIQPQGPML